MFRIDCKQSYIYNYKLNKTKYPFFFFSFADTKPRKASTTSWKRPRAPFEKRFLDNRTIMKKI